MSLPPTSYP